MNYLAIADSEIDAYSPFNERLVRKFRDDIYLSKSCVINLWFSTDETTITPNGVNTAVRTYPIFIPKSCQNPNTGYVRLVVWMQCNITNAPGTSSATLALTLSNNGYNSATQNLAVFGAGSSGTNSGFVTFDFIPSSYDATASIVMNKLLSYVGSAPTTVNSSIRWGDDARGYLMPKP